MKRYLVEIEPNVFETVLAGSYRVSDAGVLFFNKGVDKYSGYVIVYGVGAWRTVGETF